MEEFEVGPDIVIVELAIEDYGLLCFQTIKERFIRRTSSKSEKDNLLEPPGMVALKAVFVSLFTVIGESFISF